MREKLNEAQYFLGRMKDVRNIREHFRWNLSAFLSAARSVTMIMNVQYAGSKGFEGWLAEKMKEADLRTGGMVKYLNEQRRLTVHIRPLKPSAHIKVDLQMILDVHLNPAFLTGTAGTLVAGHLTQDNSMKIEKTQETKVEHTYYFDDVKDRDVLSICGVYFEEMKTVVAECEQKFQRQKEK